MNQDALKSMIQNQNQLQLLRGFYYSALYKSFEKAADKMYSGRHSIIMQVKALEVEFGAALFDQKSGHLELTEAGEVLYRLTAQIVNSIDHLRKEFEAEIGRRTTMNITIAATAGLTLYLLSQAAERFIQKYPTIKLRILNKSAYDVVDLVSSGGVDLGIAPPFRLTPVIKYEEYFSFDTILITPLNHPLREKDAIQLTDIVACPLILIDKRYAIRHRIDQIFQENNLLSDQVMEGNEWEIIKEYVRIGLGISIVPGFCMLSKLENLCYFPVSQHFGYRNYGVLYRHDKALPEIVRNFMDILHDFGKPVKNGENKGSPPHSDFICSDQDSK
ncbi:LysR family transcriptional regulator [candidate division CSSED10-310 bacterium]|uniref:LysR family transcriptional regulator n=1 Tax=candidate division CSSED10-310 bacterium TaxID=2855610 RepID=A0ABV6YUX0_UNCC1